MNEENISKSKEPFLYRRLSKGEKRLFMGIKVTGFWLLSVLLWAPFITIDILDGRIPAKDLFIVIPIVLFHLLTGLGLVLRKRWSIIPLSIYTLLLFGIWVYNFIRYFTGREAEVLGGMMTIVFVLFMLGGYGIVAYFGFRFWNSSIWNPKKVEPAD